MPQHFSPSREAGAHRADRDIEDDRDVFVAQPLETHEQDHRTLFLGQHGQAEPRPLQLCPSLRVPQPILNSMI